MAAMLCRHICIPVLLALGTVAAATERAIDMAKWIEGGLLFAMSPAMMREEVFKDADVVVRTFNDNQILVEPMGKKCFLICGIPIKECKMMWGERNKDIYAIRDVESWDCVWNPPEDEGVDKASRYAVWDKKTKHRRLVQVEIIADIKRRSETSRKFHFINQVKAMFGPASNGYYSGHKYWRVGGDSGALNMYYFYGRGEQSLRFELYHKQRSKLTPDFMIEENGRKRKMRYEEFVVRDLDGTVRIAQVPPIYYAPGGPEAYRTSKKVFYSSSSVIGAYVSTRQVMLADHQQPNYTTLTKEGSFLASSAKWEIKGVNVKNYSEFLRRLDAGSSPQHISEQDLQVAKELYAKEDPASTELWWNKVREDIKRGWPLSCYGVIVVGYNEERGTVLVNHYSGLVEKECPKEYAYFGCGVKVPQERFHIYWSDFRYGKTK